jgi:hypothetical protein
MYQNITSQVLTPLYKFVLFLTGIIYLIQINIGIDVFFFQMIGIILEGCSCFWNLWNHSKKLVEPFPRRTICLSR